jgi:CRP-like cAMP-binding protein/HEAT repeat protein
MISAIGLWRHYPRLLLQASSEHSLPSDSEDLKRLLDPTTVRALAASLSDPDPDVSRAAAELISEAEPATAAPTLATAIESAPPLTRPALIESLQIAIEPSPPGELHDARASAAVARVLANPEALTPEERADLVQIYAHLAVTHPEHATDPVLDAALGDREAAVRLAAIAELSRRGSPPPGVRDLDDALSGAFQSDDVLLRRTARKEIRANLIASNPDSVWKQRLELLARGLEHRVDREQTVRCLTEISHRHSDAIEHVRNSLLRLLSDPDPHVRAAVIAFIGKAKIVDYTADLIDGLASRNDLVVREARNSLIALDDSAIGPLVERFRSDDVVFRDLVLRTLTDLRADATVFAQIYDAEFRRTCTRALLRSALTRGCALPGHALLRCLDERIEEGLNACLCVTGVESGSERISELETKLRSTRDSHQRAILIEAMESLLSAVKRAQLIPLYETDDAFERGRVAGQQLGISFPSQEQAWLDLASDPDELIVRLHRQLPAPWLAPEESIADTRSVPLQTMQITAHLQRAVGFNRLAMRELVRIADAVEEIRLAAEEILVEEGEEDPSLFLLVSGEVSLSHRGTEIGRLGPGALVGELSSIDGGPSAERACAVTPVSALRLRRQPLMALMVDVPAFTIALSQLLAVRVRSLQSDLAQRPDAKSDEASPTTERQNGLS